jgi:hypothetical protein
MAVRGLVLDARRCYAVSGRLSSRRATRPSHRRGLHELGRFARAPARAARACQTPRLGTLDEAGLAEVRDWRAIPRTASLLDIRTHTVPRCRTATWD